jgi:hypothetical protein
VTTKAQVLLVLREGVSPSALERALAAEAARLLERAPAGTREVQLVRLEDDPTRQSAHGEEMEAAPSFDAVIELSGEDLDQVALASAFEGVGPRLEDWVVPERSAAVAGTEHTFVEGSQPLRIVMGLRRLETLTSPAFHDYWLNTHGELGRKVPGSQGYRQFHADAEASARLAAAAGVAVDDFEGVAEAYFTDMDAFMAVMSRPEIVEPLLEDERRFIDHSRSAIGLFRTVLEAG